MLDLKFTGLRAGALSELQIQDAHLEIRACQYPHRFRNSTAPATSACELRNRDTRFHPAAAGLSLCLTHERARDGLSSRSIKKLRRARLPGTRLVRPYQGDPAGGPDDEARFRAVIYLMERPNATTDSLDRLALEISPAMIEAGLDVYAECSPDLMRPSEIVRRIFLAMSQSKAVTTASTVSLNA